MAWPGRGAGGPNLEWPDQAGGPPEPGTGGGDEGLSDVQLCHGVGREIIRTCRRKDFVQQAFGGIFVKSRIYVLQFIKTL